MTPNHVVVILAAGSSRRLGRPKQLLRRNGETLLQRAARCASATGPALLVLVLPPTGAAWHALLEHIDHRPLINPGAGTGMAGSLQLAAPHVDPRAPVLILGCDQPALDVPHLQALLAGARASVSGCAATLIEGRPSMPAVVPGDWFATLAMPAPEGAGHAAHADRGFRQRLRALPSADLFLLADPDLALDIDTLADLQRAQECGLLDS